MYRCGKRGGGGRGGAVGDHFLVFRVSLAPARQGGGLMQNCPGIPSEWSEGPSHGSGAGEAADGRGSL